MSATDRAATSTHDENTGTDNDETDSVSSSEQDADEGLPPEQIFEKLEKFTEKIRSGNVSEPERDGFWEEARYYCQLAQTESYKGSGTGRGNESVNLIHRMLEKMTFEPDKHQWVLDKLLEEFPQFMTETNHEDRRPLHRAIRLNNVKFVNGVLASKYADSDGFKDLLKDTPKDGRNDPNCIHFAIAQKLDADTTIQLIQKAPAQAFVAKTGNPSLTPLHAAVDIKYYSHDESSIRVIEALIKYGDDAFDEDADGQSVYRYHKRSVENEKMRQAPNKPVRKSGRQKRKGRPEEPGPSRKEGISNSEKNISYQSFMGPGGEMSEKGGEKRQVRVPTDLSALTPATRRPSVANSTPFTLTNAYPISSKFQQVTFPAKNSPPINKGFDSMSLHTQRISKMLKLHYLRSIFDPNRPLEKARNIGSAVKFLYGENKEYVQLSLDLLEGSRKSNRSIEKSDFITAYGGMKFDQTLHYAAFRRLEVSDYSPDNPKEWGTTHLAGESKPNGRVDMVFFFRWLFNDKNIRNIIKVIVQDDLEVPHSDEAIEAALGGIDVEILDWRKLDMCPEAIRRACMGSNLRELHLQWSGNNAVLRGWSDREGLAQIKTLERIYIYPIKRLDSESRVDRNIKEFKQRLDNAREFHKFGKIEIPDPLVKKNRLPTIGGRPFAPPESKDEVEAYEWLEVMDRFANGLVNLNNQYLKDESLPLELRNGVKVAVIDDGVDILHPTLLGRIVGGESFDSGYQDPNLRGGKSPFQHSVTGHGTLMAYMIWRICPMVEIMVCKLDVYHRQTHRGPVATFTPSSAADAIDWAVRQGADIISMSWTIKQNDKNVDDMTRLQNSVDAACKSGILLFCSVPDVGAVSESEFTTYYPVGCSNPSKFHIGASTADGHPYRWTADTGEGKKFVFTLPGHKVIRSDADEINEEETSPRTGSSIATALAAGYAAVVIQCVRLAIIHDAKHSKDWSQKQQPALQNGSIRTDSLTRGITVTPAGNGALNHNHIKDIKTYKKMKSVFERMLADRMKFDNAGREISVENKGAREEDKMRAIRELAVYFAYAPVG